MSQRQIVLDTETTGLRVEEGHRVIEIGCIEMIDRKLTGKQLHCYINPEREIEAGALAVHGITNQFLQDKPTFNQVASEFVDFISGSELIIHNAPFDVSFLNNELHLTRQSFSYLTNYCQIIDTLQIARQLHVGQRNSLDALCKRYRIDYSKRDLHGALLDANLLARVYLAMTGGQGSFFDTLNESQTNKTKYLPVVDTLPIKQYNLVVLKANVVEINQHIDYLQVLKSHGKCLWPDEDT